MAACLVAGSPAQAQRGPLERFFNELFGSSSEKTQTLDLIDRHAAAASREITRSLEQCDSLIADKQWMQAIQQLQYLVDLPEDALTRSGTEWVSVKRKAEEKLLKLPEEGRRLYLNQYSAVANDQLAEARRRGDFEALCRVASRFQLTEAGQAAADEAAALLSDAGDYVSAARWYLELERHGAPLTTKPEWKSRAAAVLRQAGQPGEAQRLDPSGASQTGAATTPPSRWPQMTSAAWTEIYGGPARLNAIEGDQPLLVEEWSSRSSQVLSIQEDIEQRQSDLVAGEYRPIPVANAIAAQGLMAVRTLGGLEVRNVATGRLLWKTHGPNTAESLLLRDSSDPTLSALSLGPGDDHEGHPLSSFFYRDAVLGQLTSDGTRVFAISRTVTLLSNLFDIYSVTGAQPLEDRTFNTIVALDLATGRTLWTCGGSKSDAPFESPLAGVYFFGPPAVDGNELFAIGAAGADVNLYCLEASTGLPKWKQFIAQYDAPKIEDDFVRQMWSCTPAVSRGTIYCPTNAGWLVAVDRHRRRLSWATRYATGEVLDRYQPQYALTQLNERWAQSAPILSGGELVFAPPELPDEPMQTEAHLFRINAVDGRFRFRRAKSDAIAVGGVYGETIVILGKRGLEGWQPVEKWNTRWETPYPEDMTPCGIGVAMDGVYWMPFVEGAVVGFRLSDGGVAAVLKNSALAGRLGNLIVHRDRVISTGPTGIVGLWQKAPFEKQLVEQLAKDPRDLKARLHKARGLVSDQKFDEALQEIEAADVSSAGSETLAAEARELQWNCLRMLLTKSKPDDQSRWTQLEALARSPEQKQAVVRMQIDRSISKGEWQEALDRCWQATELAMAPVEEGELTVPGEVWLSGRLMDVWNNAPEPIRQQLTERIEKRTQLDGEKLAQDGPSAERLFGFHPEARRLSLRLGLADAASGEIALAESRLLTLTRAPEPSLAAAAATALAELYQKHGCGADVAKTLKMLQKLAPDTGLPDGTTVATWLAAHEPVDDVRRSPTTGWNLTAGNVVRLGAERDFAPGRPVWVRGASAAWLTDKRFEFSSTWYGLSMIDRLSNRSEWTMPLGSNGSSYEEWSPEGTAAGSVLALCSRGMLHVCSPLDRRLLWSWTMSPRFSTPGAYGWAEEQLSNVPVQSLASAVNDFQANVGNLREGPLMAIAGDRLVLLGQRELRVFDLRTGEEQWRRGGISGASVLVADDETVSVSAMAQGGPAAFRLRDGKTLESDLLETVFKRAFAVEGDTVLTRQGLPRPFSSQARIVAEKPLTGEAVWSQAVSADVQIHRLPGRELAGIEPTGELFVIDVVTGERWDVGRLNLEAGPRREMHVLADADRVYVAFKQNNSYEFNHVSVPSITMNGELHVFDRREKRFLWKAPISDAALLTARFADLPVVIQIQHGVPQKRRRALDALHLPELKLSVFDKRNGNRLIEWSGVTQHGSPAAVAIDPGRRRIDLFLNQYSQNFNNRVRLQFGASTP